MSAKHVLTSRNVIVFEVVALLACAVLPPMFRASVDSQADRVLADLRTVKSAAIVAYARNHEWPDAEPAGTVPAALRPFLPAGFEFDRGRYQLAWEHAPLSAPVDPRDDAEFVGVSAVVADGRVTMALVKQLEGKEFHFTIGDRTTLQLPAPADRRD
jgi:hypothetical protein